MIEEKLDYLIREVADLKQMQKDQLEILQKIIAAEGESIQEFKNVVQTFKDLVSQGFNTNVIEDFAEVSCFDCHFYIFEIGSSIIKSSSIDRFLLNIIVDFANFRIVGFIIIYKIFYLNKRISSQVIK